MLEFSRLTRFFRIFFQPLLPLLLQPLRIFSAPTHAAPPACVLPVPLARQLRRPWNRLIRCLLFVSPGARCRRHPGWWPLSRFLHALRALKCRPCQSFRQYRNWQGVFSNLSCPFPLLFNSDLCIGKINDYFPFYRLNLSAKFLLSNNRHEKVTHPVILLSAVGAYQL